MRGTLLVVTVLSGFIAVQGQSQTRSVLLQCDPMLDHLTTKQVYEVVRSFDPDGRVWLEPEQVDLLIQRDVDVDELVAAMNGLGPIHFSVVHLPTEMERMPAGTLPGDFPQYIDTGDPVADEAALATAKQTWLLNHPEYYHQPLPKPAK